MTSQPFVGREKELAAWERVLRDPEGQAVLVVGPQGMGKTSLVNKMAEVARQHSHFKCGVVRYEVTENDTATVTMGLMLSHAFEAGQVVAGSFDGTPYRRKQWEAFFKVFPKGKELVELVKSLRPDPHRHMREQFVERLQLVSKRLPDNGRAVFIIDPEKYMPDGSADEWRLVVSKLPEKVKFIFAQRPDGKLAINRDFCRLKKLVRMPQKNLDRLDDQAVRKWVEASVPTQQRQQMLDALCLYEGYPFSIDAALRLIAEGCQPNDLPADPDGLAAELWGLVHDRRDKAVRLFEAYAILKVAVPDHVVQATADLSSRQHRNLLRNDPFLRGLLHEESNGTRIYHSLLEGHLGRELDETPSEARVYHQRAIDIYSKGLEGDIAFQAFAAMRLPEHALAAEGQTAFVATFIDQCGQTLIRLGLLDAFIALSERTLAVAKDDSARQAQLIGNLGLVYRKRGDLDQAEAMHRKSLEIEEKLGRLEGMASEYGNLGNVMQTRGDLDGAEEMYRKALEIDEKLGRLEGMANQYGNLGLIYKARGDLKQAEAMHRKSLEISEKLGWLEGMASDYGNLGLIYQTRGDLDQAEAMHRKSLEIDEKLGRLEGMANQYGNLGVIYQTRGDLEQAEAMHRKSLEIEVKLGRLGGMASDYVNLGAVYEERGDLPAAREHWLKARDLFTRAQMPHMAEKMQRLLDQLPQAARASG